MAYLPVGQPDASWRLFDFDPETGKTTWVTFEGEDAGTLRARTVMPVDELFEANAKLFNEYAAGWRGDIHMVSRVPMHIWQRELAPAIQQDDKKFVAKWLNDPDHRKFRTKAGQV